MSFDPAGRVALVTGGSSGIGAATACELARGAACVVLVARSIENLASVAAHITAGGGCAHVAPCDVSDPGAVAALRDHVLKEIGTPTIVVNSAGAGRFLFIDETSVQELHDQMAVPFFAAFYMTKAFLPTMLEHGSGQIVNIDSPASLITWPGAIGYNASRFALRGLSESLRQELRGTGLGVLSVFPGKVETNYDNVNVGADLRVPRLERFTPTLTAEQMAAVIVRGIRRERRAVYAPLAVRLTAVQARLLPRLTSWLMTATGAKRDDIDTTAAARAAMTSDTRVFMPSGAPPS